FVQLQAKLTKSFAKNGGILFQMATILSRWQRFYPYPMSAGSYRQGSCPKAPASTTWGAGVVAQNASVRGQRSVAILTSGILGRPLEPLVGGSVVMISENYGH